MQYELGDDGSLTAAAAAEHRHRPRPRPHGGDPAGRAVGLRDRPLPPAGRVRRGAARARSYGAGRRDHARAARSSPTTAAARRSCSPTASCRPTRTAATSCAGSCGARSSRAACSASRARSCRALYERVIEIDGRRLPRAARRAADTIERWARAEEESFGRTLAQGERLLAERRRAREARRGPPGSPPRTRSGCTTPTASRTR